MVLVYAEKSPCKRLQVGCILVDDNRILAHGYNGYLPKCPHISIIRDDHEQATVHSEQNVISLFYHPLPWYHLLFLHHIL